MITPDVVESQGDVLRLRTSRRVLHVPRRQKRGKVTAFSRKSRRRLLELFARMNTSRMPPVFLTLTYPSNMQDSAQGKKHLKAFLERVRRKFPKSSGVWRIEYQKRGAVHFHLVLFNLPFWKADKIRLAWGEIIGEENPRVHIELCHSKRNLTYYVSKYIAKVDPAALVSLSNMPYQHAGRWWGVFNRSELPMAVLRIVEVLGDVKAFWDLRRAIDRFYPKRRKSYAGGAMLFTQNTDEWLRYYRMLSVT